jgi:hypothetical protein
MPIQSTPDGTIVVTGDSIRNEARWVTLRIALGLEIKTGMRRSNRGRSTMQLCNEITGYKGRDKRKAYIALNAFITEHGGVDRPL